MGKPLAERVKEIIKDKGTHYFLAGIFVLIATGLTLKELGDGHLGIRMKLSSLRDKVKLQSSKPENDNSKL